MPESEKFIDYCGPVDHETIDWLLTDLKKSKRFIRLHKTVAKRIYAIIVECLENIIKHSIKEFPADIRKKPFISAHETGDKIIISTGNNVHDEKRARLVKILDHINQLDQEAVKLLYEEKINRDSLPDKNGAELGFVIMKLKSEDKLDYNFTRIGNNYSEFCIRISVKKDIMRKLICEQTTSSPKVNLDPEKNIFEISGESRPHDVDNFYAEILNWFDDYTSFISRSHEDIEPAIFNLDFEYFNSSSAKYILDLCKKIAAVRSKGKDIGIKWLYEQDDIDMLEVGKEMSRMSKLPFEFVQKG